MLSQLHVVVCAPSKAKLRVAKPVLSVLSAHASLTELESTPSRVGMVYIMEDRKDWQTLVQTTSKVVVKHRIASHNQI